MTVLVPLADGFEEIEAITIIDVLRRASLDVVTAFLKSNPVVGSHKITVHADMALQDVSANDIDAIVLPGGMPGSSNLRSDDILINIIQGLYKRNSYIAAICAAPIVLAKAGVISGKKITAFPGYEKELSDAAVITGDPVTQDGKIITGKGAGCAVPFALKLVENFVSIELADQLAGKMQVYWM